MKPQQQEEMRRRLRAMRTAYLVILGLMLIWTMKLILWGR